MKQTVNMILSLALWLMTAQGAWATDEVVKTFHFNTSAVTSDNLSIEATDPDDGNKKPILTVNGTTSDIYIQAEPAYYIMNFTSWGSGNGTEAQLIISPYVDGKVTKVEFTNAGRGNWMDEDSFSLSIDGMKYNGTDDALTGVGADNESTSFTFISTDAAGISGNLTMRLSANAQFYIDKSNCDLIISYLPNEAPTHSHNFSFSAVGNTLTATCAHDDGLACSLAESNYQATLVLSLPIDLIYHPNTYYAASHNLPAFNLQTGLNATTDGISYSTDGVNYTTDDPTNEGTYTARLIVNIGGTDYTLTTNFSINSTHKINSIYPQFSFDNGRFADATTALVGETVTITFTPRCSETIATLVATAKTSSDDITLTHTGTNTYTFTMPNEEVDIAATFAISTDDYEQTATDEYTIKNANGWAYFGLALEIEEVTDGFSGKTVVLANNINTSTMVGEYGHEFKGTFDGNNHTLTFNTTASENIVAPFRCIRDATIKNLNVTGTINGETYQKLGGLVGEAYQDITIENCHVSTQISSTRVGYAQAAGIISYWGGSSSTCTVRGCVYDGLIYSPDENNTVAFCRGLVNYASGLGLTIRLTDCLFAPAEYSGGQYTVKENYECYTFINPEESNVDFEATNCYYTRSLGKKQGRPAAVSATAHDNLGFETTNYGMVRGYENGLFFNNNYYTPKYGDSVVEYSFVPGYNDPEQASVTFNGTGNRLVGVNITEDVSNVTSVTYNRPFTSGKASTVILPFDYTCNDNEGGKFYGFKDVTYDDSEQCWVCTMQETAEGELTANTPYVFVASSTTMTFPNIENMTGKAVTLKPTTDVVYGGATTNSNWQFHGSYGIKVWTELSTDYGFAATSGTSTDNQQVTAGQFVRFTTNAFIKPMRGYLSYVGSEAPARGMTSDDSSLPSNIMVRLVGRDGETTALELVNSEERTVNSDAWYTLDGRKLQGAPITKGIYVHNGKKIVK